jgi:hypothetical protein
MVETGYCEHCCKKCRGVNANKVYKFGALNVYVITYGYLQVKAHTFLSLAVNGSED